jgi:guanylate kinase
MSFTPASSYRADKSLKQKMQDGILVSFTTIHHPPEGFPAGPRHIGLIKLADGTTVTGQLLCPDAADLQIGQTVLPKMRLSKVNTEGLRLYDIAYEVSALKAVKEEFPGYLVALTGPSGVGKTTISVVLSTTIGKDVERVPIVTTREIKDGDADEYTHISSEEFADLKKNNLLATSTSIPSSTEKRWYGYRTSDIEAIWAKGKIPMVITEMNLLQGLSSHFGRRSILSFGLLPPGKSKRQMLSSLLHRLRDRGRDTEQQIKDRLKNAEADLQFFDDRKELFDHLIVNDKLETVVGHLGGLVLEKIKV